MLDLMGLLAQRGIEISPIAPDVYEQLLQVSESSGDGDIKRLRQELMETTLCIDLAPESAPARESAPAPDPALEPELALEPEHHIETIPLLETLTLLDTPTQLRGSYIDSSNEQVSRQIIVERISLYGLSFQVLSLQHIQLGSYLYVQFNLDDGEQTLICQNVVVRSVDGSKVGVEFSGEGNASEVLENILEKYTEFQD